MGFIETFHDILCREAHPHLRFARIPSAIFAGNHWGVLLCNIDSNLEAWRELCPDFRAKNRKSVERGLFLYGFTPMAQQMDKEMLRKMMPHCPLTRGVILDSILFFHPQFRPDSRDFAPFDIAKKMLSIIRQQQHIIQARDEQIRSLYDLGSLYHQGVLDIVPPDGTFDYMTEGLDEE